MMAEVTVGIDEVGRGAWAGPLVVGAVVLPSDAKIPGLKDSKLLTAAQREELAPQIKKVALACAIGIVEVAELNLHGLGKGLALAAERAVAELRVTPTLAIIDGKYPYQHLSVTQRPIVKADQTVPCVSAASVIAKVARDRLMVEIHASDSSLASFAFHSNKGYPSPAHRAALTQLGPTLHHRTCFAPIQQALNQILL